MTQYLLSVYHAGSGPDLTSDEMEQSYRDVDAFNAKLMDAGAWVFAGGLLGTESATVVRQSGSDVLVTDGPYAETKEHIGGFWIIEASDLDAALRWAKEGTTACRCPVEVRPFAPNPTDG